MVNRHQSSNIAYPSGTMTLLKIIYENIEIYENMKNSQNTKWGKGCKPYKTCAALLAI